jgi:hypothetical protein
MSKVKLVVTLASLAIVGTMIGMMPACAWLGPNVLCDDRLPVAGPAPYGTLGSGFFETVSYSTGVGSASASDSFFNGVFSPLGGAGFGGFGACGVPFCGPVGGFAQSGLGGNVGVQDSAMSTYTRSTAFGLSPLNALVFGVPVAGPAGLYFC